MWDFIASQRNTIKLANSHTTAKRIQKYYKKESVILYPPVDIRRFIKPSSINVNSILPSHITQYYLIVSALTEFKKIDIAIRSFNTFEIPLVIVGGGDFS